MNSAVIIGVLLLLVAGVIAIYLIRRQPSEEDLIRERIAEFGEREQLATLEEIELSLPFTQRILVPVFRRAAGVVGRLMPANVLESTRHKLEVAGRPGNLDPAAFLLTRFVSAVVLGGLTFILFFRASGRAAQFRFLFPPLMTAFGFFLPTIWLGSRMRARQDAIIKALPDSLDLLTICVEAGLGFDMAMNRIVEKWDDPLANEFERCVRDIGLGKLRREALRDMAARMDVPEVSTFVAAVVQASQLGVSMAKVLRIQSDQMRLRRRQRAEEKAHQAPVKMLIPMAFLIIPALFIVLLGPAVILIIKSGVIGRF